VPHVVQVADMAFLVRIIGVDTPETRDPNSPVACFGAATNRMMVGMFSLIQIRSLHHALQSCGVNLPTSAETRACLTNHVPSQMTRLAMTTMARKFAARFS
jgi:hypothetical protein